MAKGGGSPRVGFKTKNGEIVVRRLADDLGSQHLAGCKAHGN